MGVALVVSIVVLGIGLYMVFQEAGGGQSLTGAALVAAGALGSLAGLVLLPITVAVVSSRQRDQRHQDELLTTLTDRLQQLSIMLNEMSEQLMLSDRAKAIAFRGKDREALRRAIRDEIGNGDYEAALALVNDMEASFGYRQEAETLRQDISSKRSEVIRKQITDQTHLIDQHVKAERWRDAVTVADRLMRLFPEDETVKRLPADIEARRNAMKKQLLESWNDAVARHDVDGSIEILKKLDTYLTPAEAVGLQETARSIFKEKLNGLRTQFALAVQEHQWEQAVRHGETIVRDFPNSKMASEVGEKLSLLRQRATGAIPAPAGV